jgi:hypothetical protein
LCESCAAARRGRASVEPRFEYIIGHKHSMVYRRAGNPKLYVATQHFLL